MYNTQTQLVHNVVVVYAVRLGSIVSGVKRSLLRV